MSKVCEVCVADSSVEVLWSCVGCTRSFHPSCVGVSSTRGSLRIKKVDKKTVDPSSFLLPCCESCQSLVSTTFDFNALAEQQKLLTKQINDNTEVMHRLAQKCERPSDVHQIMESLETLLNGLKDQMASLQKKYSVNDAMSTTRDVLISSIASSISDFKKDVKQSLTNINNEICQLNQLSIETATSCTMHNNPMVEFDIIGELKMLSTNVDELKSKIVPAHTSPDPLPSLEFEVNLVNADNSGWRFLGTRRVWKADWTEYDERKKRRLQQQKMADAAKIRRNQRKMAYNNNNHNGNRHNYNHNGNHHNYNKNLYHNANLNFNSNNYQNSNLTNHHNNNNKNNYNYIQLPTDRELLAAAKDQFSRPPPIHQHIQFQRGEILNPYQTSDASTVSIPTAPTRSFNMTTSGISPAAVCSSSSVPGHAPVAIPTISTAQCQACICNHSCFPRN